MDGEIIDWDARQQKLRRKVEEYHAARAQEQVEDYLHQLRLDLTIERPEVLQAIVDDLIEQRRLLVISGDGNGEAFAQIEGELAEMQTLIDKS